MTALVDILPAGDHAVLVQFAPDIPAADLHARAEAVRGEEGVLACVVGHSSLYVIYETKPEALWSGGLQSAARRAEARRYTIHVAFDGADLDAFLKHTRQTRDEFLKRVRGLRLTVRYLGFRGGFAYLDGWPAEWAMPRRPTSRPVARGSFAIAGGVAGFYPIDSPGGWNILGRTNEELEYRFAPGNEIVLGLGPAASGLGSPERRVKEAAAFSAPFMTHVEPPNWKNLERGMPVGGPFDPELASCVEGDVYEFAQIGPKIDEGEYAWADLNGVRIVHGPIEVGRITNGLRGYLGKTKAAARGPRPEARTTIFTMRGPHDIGVDELECVVTPKLDRIGIRMELRLKPALRPPADMPSCGMQFGTLQLHPDGSIVAMGPEHPVTGGYLQPMTVLWSERWKLAHLAPGERVRFVARR